jgi:5-methylcytosine-specific restriction endonuclease McrA
MLAYWARNPEKKRALQQAYHERNRESINARKRDWAATNREQERERLRQYRDPEKDRERARQWNVENREQKREHRTRRRALLRGQGGQILKRDWMRLLARYGGRCAYCNAKATEQDHVIPLSRGGRHTIGNVLPACLPCNRSKHDHLLVEWSRPSWCTASTGRIPLRAASP